MFYSLRLFSCFWIFFLSICVSKAQSQVKERTVDTSALMKEFTDLKGDSLLSELRSMMDSMSKPSSFFSVNTSVSNKLFSTNNNALNSQQANTNVLAFIPTVSYFNKSGVGLSVASYMRNVDGKFSLYQTAITPSYDKIEKKIMYGISYTHYLKTNKVSSSTTPSTPYNNDVYTYIQGRKTWLKPSLALGWAGGGYEDVSTIPIKRNGNYYWIRDTATVKLNDLTLIAGVSHSFNFSDVFSKGDGVSLMPQLSITGGQQNFTTVHKVPLQGIIDRQIELERLQKLVRSYNSSSSSKPSLQSIGLSTNLSYMKNIVSLSMGYYLGYYFNSSSGNNLIHIINMNISLTF